MARLFDDGDSEYLEVDSAPVLTETLSMACWFNSDDTGANQGLVYIGDSGSTTHRFQLMIRGGTGGDPVIARARDPGADGEAATSSGYSANTWHSALATFTNDTSRAAYIDGANKGTDSTDVAVVGPDRISVGRAGDASPGDYMSGMIAEVAVWDVALTDGDALILAAGFSPLFIKPENLVFYAPLVRTDEDRIGAIGLVAVNGPTVATHPRIIYPAPPHIITAPTVAVGVSIPVMMHHYKQMAKARIN